MQYQIYPGKVVELHFYQWVIVRLIDFIDGLIDDKPGAGANGWFEDFIASIWLHYTLARTTK